MSTGELIGLSLTAGLLAGAISAAAVAWVVLRQQSARETRSIRIDAYSRWLAGCLTLSRASVSFIAAFRALGAEPRSSAYFSLRAEEAQRARAYWGDAMRELDVAEAALLVWDQSPSLPAELARFPRVEARELRVTIDGDETDMDEFAQKMRAADEAAVRFVQRETAPPNSAGGPTLARLILRTAKQLQSIVHRWARP
ncbi:MAG: hypothetical protein KJ749_00385 [Planctomycetes bacterium]|nr:hypothetical protein [Planctomycetota bacterium]